MNKLLTLIDPVLKFIDSGNLFRKPFSWLYAVIAVLQPLLAIFALSRMFSLFKFMPGGAIFLMILVWIVFAALCCIGFLFWWKRKDHVAGVVNDSDNFVAIPVLTHFIQTLGEWLGITVAVMGVTATLAALFYSDLHYFIPLNAGSAAGLVAFPVAGFLIVVITRFISEAWRALAAIANNTRRTADNVSR